MDETNLLLPATPTSHEPMNNLDRATLAANTDMVRILFGVPGACWGSFPCSHARIPGRMYAITTSVLFYSNVLGFERRFCLNFADIVAISLHRTTSLRFELANDEVYVFRSFPDREQVLGLLVGLRRLSTKDSTNLNASMFSPQLRLRAETTRTVLLDVDQPQMGGDESSLNPQDTNSSLASLSQRTLNTSNHDSFRHSQSAPSSSFRLNRRRAASDSVVRQLGFDQEDANNNKSIEEGKEQLLSIHEEHRPALQHALSAPLLDANDTDPTMIWETEKGRALTYENTGVEDVRLDCTLDDYFDLFLADNAPHSFSRFQTEMIADKDVTITDWATNEVYHGPPIKEYLRKLSFKHPIKSSIGPSEACTQRHQTLRRFGSYGMILTNSTQVSGIPAADCFKAEDHWIIEAHNSETIMISARFAPRFHKRTMLKGLIERSIKRETTEWFRLYFDMVRTALEDRARSKTAPRVEPHEHVGKEESALLVIGTAIGRIYPVLLLIVVLLLAMCVIGTLQTIQTSNLIALMEEEKSTGHLASCEAGAQSKGPPSIFD